MKETSLMLCKCSEDVYLELVAQTQVFGHPGEFVVHMADFYSLHEDLRAKVETNDLYKK